jgi:hypothetical protein
MKKRCTAGGLCHRRFSIKPTGDKIGRLLVGNGKGAAVFHAIIPGNFTKLYTFVETVMAWFLFPIRGFWVHLNHESNAGSKRKVPFAGARRALRKGPI